MPNRILIHTDEDGTLKLDICDVIWHAKSLIVEAAPFQEGTIFWLSQARTAAMPESKSIVPIYVDKDGEPVDKDLMEYMIERLKELEAN